MQYSIETITAADDLDLLSEVKAHAKIYTGTVENDLLQRYLQTAYSLFEEKANITLTPTVYKQHFANWKNPLRLARGKVISVDAVTYYDEDDAEQTLAVYNSVSNSTGWRADYTILPCTLYFPEYAPPTLSTYRLLPVAVEYTAGSYADQDYLPHDIIQAIILAASHMYLNRENYTETNYTELPMGFSNIALKYLTGLHSF
jgi:uncharacterized phiE125 gp8 family phage protein